MPEKNYRNSEQDRRIVFLEEKFANINSEMGDVKKDIGEIKTNINWLSWYVKLSAGAAISSLIIGLVQLLSR